MPKVIATPRSRPHHGAVQTADSSLAQISCIPGKVLLEVAPFRGDLKRHALGDDRRHCIALGEVSLRQRIDVIRLSPSREVHRPLRQKFCFQRHPEARIIACRVKPSEVVER